jgi:hypothetical protein
MERTFEAMALREECAMNAKVARISTVAAICAVGLITWLALPAGAQSRRGRGTAERDVPPRSPLEQVEERHQKMPPPERPSVRFEATVFQVEVAKAGIIELDARKLAAEGPTPAALAQVLQSFGTTDVLYRVDQVIAAGDGPRRISIARDTPYMTGLSTTSTGQVTTLVARERVGGEFKVDGHFRDPADKGCLQTSLEIEIAALSGSQVEVGKDITAPVFWRVEQTYAGATELGKPIVLLSVDGAATTGSDKILAFVSLVKFSNPAE